MKSINSKKRSHADKVLKEVSQATTKDTLATLQPKVKIGRNSKPEVAIKNQYELIQKDFNALKKDIAEGVDLIKNYFDSDAPKDLVKGFLKSKSPFV